jgi:hypothetical protein
VEVDMSELDLKVIRTRANAATGGPWSVERDEYIFESRDDLVGTRDCCIDSIEEKGARVVSSFEYNDNIQKDAEFIAHARQDVPALLDRVEELEKEIAFLRSKPRKRQGISSVQRFRIFSRDRFTCRYCGARGGPDVPLEIDHHTPVSKGGGNDDENLWTACFECNRGKRDVEIKR